MCRRRALKHFVADDCGPGDAVLALLAAVTTAAAMAVAPQMSEQMRRSELG
jgi:hypothetical protein